MPLSHVQLSAYALCVQAWSVPRDPEENDKFWMFLMMEDWRRVNAAVPKALQKVIKRGCLSGHVEPYSVVCVCVLKPAA